MSYCQRCGFGIGSQGHEDCCVTKTGKYTRNGNRINTTYEDLTHDESDLLWDQGW